jgi:hypothetical protein
MHPPCPHCQPASDRQVSSSTGAQLPHAMPTNLVPFGQSSRATQTWKSSGIEAPWWSSTHLHPEFDSHGACSRIAVQTCANLSSHCHPWIGLQPAAVPAGQSCCGSHSHPAEIRGSRSGADLGPHCGAGGTQTSSLLRSRCVPFGQSDSSKNIPVGQKDPS